MGKPKKKNRGGGGTKLKAKFGQKRNFKAKNNNNHNRKGKSVAMESQSQLAPVQDDKMKITNPFEIRTHRPKHDYLGKRGKHEKGGIPGISRSKAIEKRRETLLKEYKVRTKSNIIIDKRIGEKVKNMPEEEKLARRSVMEKRRQYKQKSIFNLPSTDDILTHKGQLLMDIDRYEDPREDSDSEDERLGEEFVSDAHFAGDFLKYKDKGNDNDDLEESHPESGPKSRKDIIAELILQSKQRKMEKAKEADETYELVSKLDEEFKSPDFRNLLNFVKKGVNEHEPPPLAELQKKKNDDYDKLVRELQFERKTGLASNRLKTEEEVQEEELKKLKRLEKERLRRMNAQDPNVPNHRSADDLGDDFNDSDDDVPVVSYKEDGQLNKLSKNEEDQDEDVSEEEDEGSEEEEEESKSEDEDNDSDAFSDLQSEDERDEDKKVSATSDQKSLSIPTSTSENDDIPFTLALPKNYETYRKLMVKYKSVKRKGEELSLSVERYRILLERLVKYSLLAEKQRLPELFLYILKFINDVVDQSGEMGKDVKEAVVISSGHLHTLLVTDTERCVEMMETHILPNYLASGKGNKVTLAKVALFQICSKLFCVTDFCHRVLSPMKVNISELINSTCSSYKELLKMLALVDIIYDVSKESKRYSPEVIKLLIDVLEGVVLPKTKLFFKRRRFEFLKLDNLMEECQWDPTSSFDPDSSLHEKEDTSPPTKSQVLSVLLRVFDLLSKFVSIQYKTKPFNHLIYKAMSTQFLVLSLKWEDKNFHKDLYSRRIRKENVTPVPGETEKEELPACVVERPKILKLYEPVIEENFDGNQRKKLKRKGMTQEAARLNHKVKKEMKSAYREMLKDNAFLAKQQMKEQAMKDADRNRRVKEILGGLANQEGDYRRKRYKK